MHVGSLYAVAALVGTISLVVLVALGVPTLTAAIVCVVLTFTVRVLAVLFHWTLPEQKPLKRLSLIRRKQRPTRLSRRARRSPARGRPTRCARPG